MWYFLFLAIRYCYVFMLLTVLLPIAQTDTILTSGKSSISIAASLQAYFIRYALRFPFAMKGSIISGTRSGESRHTASNSTIFGCLKHFILAHSSKKDFTSDLEYNSVYTQ